MESKEKIKSIIDYAKEHTALETKNYVLKVFKENEIAIQKEDIHQAYYDSHILNVYPKDMQGMYISIQEGDWDRLGANVSHKGMDIHIVNPLHNNETMTLFQESEKVLKGNVDIDNNRPIQKEDVLGYLEKYNSSTFVYQYLPEDMKEDKDIIKSFVLKLETKARDKANEEREYSDISPNGGMDVYVHDWQDYFLEELNMFQDGNNIPFVQFAENYFCSDKRNHNYIENELLRNEKIVYFVEHKEDYIAEYNYNAGQVQDNLNFDIQYMKNAKKELEQDIVKEETEIVEMQKKLEKLENSPFHKFFNKKKIEELKMEIEGYEPLIRLDKEKLENMKLEINNLISKQDSLFTKQEDLKYKFDYLLKDTFAEVYDYSENFHEALKYMENAYPEAKNKFEHLNRLSTFSYEDKIESMKNEQKKIEIDKESITQNDTLKREKKNEKTGLAHIKGLGTRSERSRTGKEKQQEQSR